MISSDSHTAAIPDKIAPVANARGAATLRTNWPRLVTAKNAPTTAAKQRGIRKATWMPEDHTKFRNAKNTATTVHAHNKSRVLKRGRVIGCITAIPLLAALMSRSL